MKNLCMKKVLTTFGIAVLFTALNSCNRTSKEDKIIDIEKEFSIQLWEKLDDSGGNLQFIVSTIKEQPCAGTKIDYSSNRYSNNVVLTVKDLIKPANCTTVNQKVTDTVTIGSLETGSYKLNINLKDVILNNGYLYVDQGRFNVVMSKEDGISVSTEELKRVPSGTIWGYLSYDNTQEAKYIKFFDNLNKMATNANLQSGNYGYFKIDGNKNVEIKANFDTKKANIKKIFYTLSKSTAELENLVNEYKSQGLELKIFTYNGKEF